MRCVRFLRRIIAFTSARSFGIGFREPQDPFQPWSTWTAFMEIVVYVKHTVQEPRTRCCFSPRIEPLKGLEPYNMESGTDLCHPLDMRLLLRTALYPTQRRTPSGFNSPGMSSVLHQGGIKSKMRGSHPLQPPLHASRAGRSLSRFVLFVRSPLAQSVAVLCDSVPPQGLRFT